jgi:hypothetical protein
MPPCLRPSRIEAHHLGCPDARLEGVRLIAAVFYTLIRKQMHSAGGGAKH